jgi:hypothetical protein
MMPAVIVSVRAENVMSLGQERSINLKLEVTRPVVMSWRGPGQARLETSVLSLTGPAGPGLRGLVARTQIE